MTGWRRGRRVKTANLDVVALPPQLAPAPPTAPLPPPPAVVVFFLVFFCCFFPVTHHAAHIWYVSKSVQGLKFLIQFLEQLHVSFPGVHDFLQWQGVFSIDSQ